ncbi:hypothetical protein M501DRAFT_1015004 [Patellaria atrata CBS 101060]|uniref:Uncharacterized protein n=1 Tax=Patellaria atrata CBS 101060 TaxID=1346257 RepID=A0A9P4VTK2_9PEZI|nr:hypothetical protein M501DRAFT_1015004 [Patellaria atrata CBS 101060]
MSLPSVPGLFFVNSGITSPNLNTTAWNSWYNNEHIRDLLQTSEVHTAYRYYSTYPEETDQPYLAFYPLQHVAWLESEEFITVPNVSSTLNVPEINQDPTSCYDVADFEFRAYSTVGGYSTRGTAPYVVTLTFDTDDEVDEAWVNRYLRSLKRTRGYRGGKVYKHESSFGDAPPESHGSYFAIHGFNHYPRYNLRTENMYNVETSSWQLLAALGNVRAGY